MKRNILLDDPNLGKVESKYLLECVKTNFVSTAGPFVPEFENKFSEFLSLSKAVSLQSGTSALHLALIEAGITKGDEVIVPALTFVAPINAILYVNAKPVIVDVDINTWNIDPAEILKAITPKTKAIIPVHLYGNPCAMDEIKQIAKKHKLIVIEDSTESLGSKYDGQYTGTIGDFGCFSFNGNKLLTTGGGGMIVARNAKKLDHIKFLANQSRDNSKGYYHPEIGFNYRMTNLEAALGLAQLSRINEFIEKKNVFSKIYKKTIGNINSIKFQQQYPLSKAVLWLTCLSFTTQKGDIFTIAKKLKLAGIPTRRIFYPTNLLPYLKKYSKKCKNSEQIYKTSLCLPSSTCNNESSISFVANKIMEI